LFDTFATRLSAQLLRRFLPLSAANVYSLLQYLVLGNNLQGREIGHPPLP
jgi:hypothetical protein